MEKLMGRAVYLLHTYCKNRQIEIFLKIWLSSLGPLSSVKRVGLQKLSLRMAQICEYPAHRCIIFTCIYLHYVHTHTILYTDIFCWAKCLVNICDISGAITRTGFFRLYSNIGDGLCRERFWQWQWYRPFFCQKSVLIVEQKYCTCSWSSGKLWGPLLVKSVGNQLPDGPITIPKPLTRGQTTSHPPFPQMVGGGGGGGGGGGIWLAHWVVYRC